MSYDIYYKVEDYFGAPYPELISFFVEYPKKGKLLDMGCGQGRNAIALARMGYSIIGIDTSKTGIEQMNAIAQREDLDLTGFISDIYTFENYSDFDVVLLDSMFHFAKNDKQKEISLIRNIFSNIKEGSLFVVCILDTGNKVNILNQAIESEHSTTELANKKFKYLFEDKESGHKSVSNYRLIVIRK